MNLEISESKKGLTTFDLKVIGIILMFIDHVHQMFAVMGAPNWLDCFGRPVATMFFFISAEGFAHTHNKKKYLGRLLLGYWVMNLGSFMIQKFFSIGDMGLQNNIFSDLFIAVLTMYGIELINDGRKAKKVSGVIGGVLAILAPILSSGVMLLLVGGSNPLIGSIFGMIVPNLLVAENSILLYLAVAFYLLRNHRRLQCAVLALAALAFAVSDVSGMFTTNTQWMMIFAIIPILLYNGEKGKGMRWFFYIFYPAHIWILYIIASIVYTNFY